MSNLKLGVEVVSADDLMSKDGQGSCNALVELHFEGQKFRTTTKDKDLSPVWNESFFFNVSDPTNLSNLTLDAYVYNHNKTRNSKSFLGKVRLTLSSFVTYSDAVVLHYPLEKQTVFSRVKGVLGLKVFVTDDPSIKLSVPAMDSSLHTNFLSTHAQTPEQEVPNLIPNIFSNENSVSRHTFHHLPNPQQQHHVPLTVSQQPMNYGTHEMKSEPRGPRNVDICSGSSLQPDDFLLKETSPLLGGGRVVGGRIIRGDNPSSTYDLVEKMTYLFVRVVKARDLPSKDVTGSLDPFVEVKMGNYTGITRHYEKKQNPEWNQVFAFAGHNIQSSLLEVVVRDKDIVMDDFVGIVRFDLNEVPTRVPPDSPLAAEWYLLEDRKGQKTKGELMLTVWYGTQADEAFPDAFHSDNITRSFCSLACLTHIRSKVYKSPRLWYVRVNVIEAQDLVVTDKNRFPDVFVEVHIGNQVLKTKPAHARSINPIWNEDLMFVTAEPFEDPLVLSVEDHVAPNKDENIGKVVVPLNTVEKRADDQIVRSRWFKLEKSTSVAMDGDRAKKDKFYSRLHLRVSLDGGYHVFDESTWYSSDLRPTAKQLWKPSIGVLELGILQCIGLHPMKTRDGRGTSDTYCVAKYGDKWVRTRTIIDSLSPKYNEQYTWEVYDSATVLTVGAFDNNHIGDSGGQKDVKIGRVRIRLSTLETGRVYTHSYPLLCLHPSGVKKMGELHLAIRFSYTSMVNAISQYSQPLLPKMHYMRPLTVTQQDFLHHHAVNIVAARLSRAAPPLGKEVIEYMSDGDFHLWSLRRSKTNFFRLISVFSGLFSVGKWFWEVCIWKDPITTVLVHVLFIMLVCGELILPTVFICLFLIGLWNYRYRPGYPPHTDTRISHAHDMNPDELDEEFDTFPTARSADIVRMRYDRLRGIAGRIQTLAGDVATQGERIQALLSWRDPRATAIFVIFCLVAAIILYVTPSQVLTLLAGFYFMRHPRLRHRMPSALINFFRRLPAKTDSIL